MLYMQKDISNNILNHSGIQLMRPQHILEVLIKKHLKELLVDQERKILVYTLPQLMRRKGNSCIINNWLDCYMYCTCTEGVGCFTLHTYIAEQKISTSCVNLFL